MVTFNCPAAQNFANTARNVSDLATVSASVSCIVCGSTIQSSTGVIGAGNILAVGNADIRQKPWFSIREIITSHTYLYTRLSLWQFETIDDGKAGFLVEMI
jgi:hypothetical protein